MMTKSVFSPNDVDEKEVFIKKRLNDVLRPVVLLPQAFQQLHAIRQKDACEKLQLIPVDLQQALLNDWSDRIKNRSIRNPAGYLFALIAQAKAGTYVPPAFMLKETLPAVHYEYLDAQDADKDRDDSKDFMESPVAQPVPQPQEAAVIAREILKRAKTYQAQKKLEPEANAATVNKYKKAS
ncbi:MAG: hypothetical protein ACRCWR_09715 [Saezia sp.]